jgi:hypothetical protein
MARGTGEGRCEYCGSGPECVVCGRGEKATIVAASPLPLTEAECEEVYDRTGRVVYVDVPVADRLGEEECWENVGRFESVADAVAWIRENVGPCDDAGNVCLITNG